MKDSVAAGPKAPAPVRGTAHTGPAQAHLGRHRGVLPEPRPDDRGRRAGARRVSSAARGRQGQVRPVRRIRRHDQDARASARVLAVGPLARGRTAVAARPRLSRTVRLGGQALVRRGVQAGGAGRSQGQALRRSGMDDQPVLRLRQTGLPPRHRLGREARGRHRGSRPAHAAEGGVLCAADSPTRCRHRTSC